MYLYKRQIKYHFFPQSCTCPITYKCPEFMTSWRSWVPTHLHKKDSHSKRNVRVFSRPWVSEPHCSKPKRVKSFRMSRRSCEDMSQCLCSLISVKIHGLIRAPLKTDTGVSLSRVKIIGQTGSPDMPRLPFLLYGVTQ